MVLGRYLMLGTRTLRVRAFAACTVQHTLIPGAACLAFERFFWLIRSMWRLCPRNHQIHGVNNPISAEDEGLKR